MSKVMRNVDNLRMPRLVYAARMARFDLLRPVQGLAKWFTKCKKRHDEELYRLVCYIHTTTAKKMIGWVADKMEDIQPHLFSDSDFAGSEGTPKIYIRRSPMPKGPSYQLSIVRTKQKARMCKSIHN